MILCLIPIIYIEQSILIKRLGVPAKLALKTSSLVNLMTTFIGVPITWGLLVLIQKVTGGGSVFGYTTIFQKILASIVNAPWLGPSEGMIPIAYNVLLVPFFFASWYLEYKVAAKYYLKEYEVHDIKKAFFAGNIYSYLFLSIIASLYWSVASVFK